MQKQRVTTARYDIAGHRIGRVMRQDSLYRLMPIGNFGGGPNVKFLVQFRALHTFARLYYAVKFRIERPTALFRRVFRIR